MAAHAIKYVCLYFFIILCNKKEKKLALFSTAASFYNHKYVDDQCFVASIAELNEVTKPSTTVRLSFDYSINLNVSFDYFIILNVSYNYHISTNTTLIIPLS